MRVVFAKKTLKARVASWRAKRVIRAMRVIRAKREITAGGSGGRCKPPPPPRGVRGAAPEAFAILTILEPQTPYFQLVKDEKMTFHQTKIFIFEGWWFDKAVSNWNYDFFQWNGMNQTVPPQLASSKIHYYFFLLKNHGSMVDDWSPPPPHLNCIFGLFSKKYFFHFSKKKQLKSVKKLKVSHACFIPICILQTKKLAYVEY